MEINEYEAEEKKNLEGVLHSHILSPLRVFSPCCLEVIKYPSDTSIYSVSYFFIWAEILGTGIQLFSYTEK